MTEDTTKQGLEPISPSADDTAQPLEQKIAKKGDRKDQVKEREEQRRARAAQKLRENLQRRKHQARARRSGEEDDTIGLPAAKTDESC
jgi:hypothetical protein